MSHGTMQELRQPIHRNMNSLNIAADSSICRDEAVAIAPLSSGNPLGTLRRSGSFTAVCVGLGATPAPSRPRAFPVWRLAFP